MAKRGRTSKAELEVVVSGEFDQRAEPPEDLTERQKTIWSEVVASEPAAFFRTAAVRGMLADYCRHRESIEFVSASIAKFDPTWMANEDGCKRYDDLIKMRDRETRAAAGLATKMRLTNQSRYTPHAAAAAGTNQAKSKKPWES